MTGLVAYLRVLKLWMLIVGALLAAASVAESQSTEPRTVTVTGRGATYREAHFDGTRKALEQVVRQLVVHDQNIADGAIKTDRILSTMNGYIDGHEVVSVRRDASDGAFLIEERFTVSQTRIANFLGAPGKGPATIAGGLLDTNAQRDIQQRKLLGELFDRFLQGFPSQAVELTFGSITPDVRNPAIYNLTLSVQISPLWLDTFRAAIGAIAIGAFSETHGQGSPYLSNSAWRGTDTLQAPSSKLTRQDAQSIVCIVDARKQDCYKLPPGHYGETTLMRDQNSGGAFEAPPLMIAIRFTDGEGRSTLTGGRRCLLKRLSYVTSRTLRRLHGSGNIGRDYFVFGNGVTDTVEIKAEDVDMASSKSFAAVAFFGARQFPGYVSLHAGNIRDAGDPGVLQISDIAATRLPQADVCGPLLDEAFLTTNPARR
jgi:hypothetical protein